MSASGMLAAMSESSTKKPRRSAAGEETRRRIIEATLTSLTEHGIVGTSARSIAKIGDFNQALIFYHFGSVDDAVIAAVAQMSDRRMQNHRSKLEQATSLPDLIRIARELHADDTDSDNMAIMTQAFAGAAADADMGSKLYQQLEPWSEMVATTIERVLGDTPVAPTVPHRQIADAISALFLGIELLDTLEPARGHAAAMFDSLESLAELLDDLLATPLLEFLRP